MEAAGLHDAAKNLLPFGKKEYLPAVAIYGMVSHSFFQKTTKKAERINKGRCREKPAFFAISCTMNYKPCIEAMKWFRKK